MKWLRRLFAQPARPADISTARVGIADSAVALTIGTCVTVMTPDQARALAAGLARWASKADRKRGMS